MKQFNNLIKIIVITISLVSSTHKKNDKNINITYLLELIEFNSQGISDVGVYITYTNYIK